MKKLMLLVLVLSGLLASCTDIPVPSLLYEEKQVIYTDQSDDVSVFQMVERIEGPSGHYILVRYYSNGSKGQQIFADLYLNSEMICSWDLHTTQPWDRAEDTLYFTSDNCNGLDPRNVISWNVKGNSSEIFFEDQNLLIDIPIWTFTGGKYYQLHKQN